MRFFAVRPVAIGMIAVASCLFPVVFSQTPEAPTVDPALNYTAAELDQIESDFEKEELELARQILELKLRDRLDSTSGGERFHEKLDEWWAENDARLVTQADRRTLLDRLRPKLVPEQAPPDTPAGATGEIRSLEAIRGRKFRELVPRGPDVDAAARNEGLAEFNEWLASDEGRDITGRIEAAGRRAREERAREFLDATASVALEPVPDETPQQETARLQLKLRREAARRLLRGDPSPSEAGAMAAGHQAEFERLEEIAEGAAIERLRERIRHLSEQADRLEPSTP